MTATAIPSGARMTPRNRPTMSNSEETENVTTLSEPAVRRCASGPTDTTARSCPIGNGRNPRIARGGKAEAAGRAAERLAEAALARDGWSILGRRLRTASGEIDLVAERDGVTAFVEVKARPTLAEAAFALTPRQQARLAGAAAILLGRHPDWGRNGVRFDVLLVDAAGSVRRIADAFRPD